MGNASVTLKEVPIKNRDFPADFSPNLYIVTCHFYYFYTKLRPLSKVYGRPILKFPKKKSGKMLLKMRESLKMTNFSADFSRNPYGGQNLFFSEKLDKTLC